MRNTLTIKAVELKSIGAAAAEFGIVATDSFGTSIDFGYTSKEALFKEWPDRLSAARKVFAGNAFDGTGYVDAANRIILDSFSAIAFEGFPDSEALTIKQFAEV